MTARSIESARRRHLAADLAAARPPVVHHANGDEMRLRGPDGRPTYAGSFTKCLPHGEDGFLLDPRDYSEWVRSITSGDIRDVRALRVGPGPFTADGSLTFTETGPRFDWVATYPDPPGPPGFRAWESQGAGATFDLEGPDAQAVTMPPPPSLDSQELIAEMGELYWMALCRDRPFAGWATDTTVTAARASLARLWWFRADRTDRLVAGTDVLPTSLARRRVLSPDGQVPVGLDTVFRGAAPGARTGPYVSQLMLVGNRGITRGDSAHALTDGLITYGALRLDQRVRTATPGEDHLTRWPEFLDVQNGADVRGRESYVSGPGAYRFVATPRDLATYVHYDALYEAYLNACLVLIGLGAPVDPGLPFQLPDWKDKQQGFAQFGFPHLLSLVTEVATRALKAVRHQKYGVHRRLRPEALGGWMYQRRQGDPAVVARLGELAAMEAAFRGSSGIGAALDAARGVDEWLLPVAFPEGSPTHPSYGAGHATVAGACTTVLKAWFDSAWTLTDAGTPLAYEADATGSALVDVSATLARPLTVEGELNKLAANVAIGRDWAGVHYHSDYHESFRLGERVALDILEEQRVCYGESFSLTVPLADGTVVQV